ncbi:MAG: N-acetyl-gamma-glutamyl-phosphate reductase [Deltaproteobacteria bacterium]|nr:N-acetyl-gamma-glutamyl-phosphate reductase [Deltaproteobacteria bacterium]
MPEKTRKAVVWGAGGFVGAELLRLLACHPEMELAAALSDTHADKPVGAVHPNLAPWTHIDFISSNNWSWDRLDTESWVLFSAQPHVKTMRALPPVLEKLDVADVKVVDLSGDFRLGSTNTYRKYYGVEHKAPEYLDRFAYGLPEGNRPLIAEAEYVANPGCFATCAQLAILPMATLKKQVLFAAIDGKTGSSGAGVAPRVTTHHPNRMNNFRAYKQLTHQHFPEIQGGWLRAGGASDTVISFVPQMAPMVRGIFVTAHFFTTEPVTEKEMTSLYTSFYADAPFIRVVDGSPSVADVWGTNRCDISVAAQDNKIVVCAAIDNLVKGAAGQAIQCANLACGFEETAGLLTPPPRPV